MTSPPASADAEPATYSKAWRRLLDVEREVDQADWKCREDVYDGHVEDAEQAIAAFAARHSHEIEQELTP